MTCWRRLAAWNEAGVWGRLHQLLLNELRSRNQLDWEREVINPSRVRAARRCPKAGVDGQSVPLAVSLIGGDATMSPFCCPSSTRSRRWPTVATATTSTAACSGNAASGP